MVGSKSTYLDYPESYSAIPFAHIEVSHVPESALTATQVLLISLNRPDRLNSYTVTMQQELEKVYSYIDRDPRVCALVLTGKGKSFCAGADLDVGFLGTKGKDGNTVLEKRQRDAEHRDSGGRLALAIMHCSKPTVAAINGSAVGIGITMSLPACIRIAYAKAKVGFVFSQRGIIMEACSSFFLPRLIGVSRTLHLVTTGAVYPAENPIFGTLFSEICATPEATVSRALEVADQIAKNTSIVSTKLMRDLVYRGPDSPEAAHLLDSRILHGIMGGKDNAEGLRSFMEKRPAQFSGQIHQDAPEAYPWWTPIDIGQLIPQPGHPKL